MNILIFGVGKFYQRRRKILNNIGAQDDFLGFVDNYGNGKNNIDGLPIYRPESILRIEFDIIILMSAHFHEMKTQLLELGIPETKILFWEEYFSLKSHGKLQIYTQNTVIDGKKKILLLTTELNYNGGSIAIVYAAKCLVERGYAVCVAAPDGDATFINEIVADGLNVLTVPSLPYLGTEELFWINQFDIVMVNVFQMVQCACEISYVKPVLWWIHEPSGKYSTIYEDIQFRFSKYDNLDMMGKIRICAVSKIARRNFEEYYLGRIDGILSYGISDAVKNLGEPEGGKSGKVVFAVIGGVSKRKAQNIFVKAIESLLDEERSKAEFWIIGSYNENDSVVEMARGISEVKFTGLLTREQMWQTFPMIDVVVCPSFEDPMPIVVTEGMMYSKPCIVSDSVGQAQYIRDGENGFVCATGDVRALAEKMCWCIKNRDALGELGKRSRKIYEKFFSMEQFGARLEAELMKTEKDWNAMQEQRSNLHV